MGGCWSAIGFISLEASRVLVVVKHFEESSRQRVKGIGGWGTEPARDGVLVWDQGVAKSSRDRGGA